MNGVALITMPFATSVRPSLGLSLLKASLARQALPCDLFYFNLLFAKRIGEDAYERIAESNPDFLMGDWIFAAALFGDQIPPPRAYFAEVLRRVRRPFHESTFNRSGGISTMLEAAREQVPAFLVECIGTVPWQRFALVGFTTTFQQNTASLAIAAKLKDRYPHLAIVLGGANCEGEMGIALHRLFPFVDYVCSGEGDVSFPVLAQHIVSHRAPADIPGIIRRAHEHTVTPSRMTAPVTDMDSLPVPDYDDFIAQRAALKPTDSPDLYLVTETARGCWWGEKSHCTFCGLNGSTMQFRAKSPERAIAEIQDLTNRYHPREIAAVDNIIDMQYFRTVLPQLAALKLDVELFYETKANLRKEQVSLLREAGVVRIQPGIESLSTNVLRLMRKGVTAMQNIQLLRWCAEYMVQPGWNLIAGFPGEDPADYARQAEIVPLLVHLAPPLSVARVRLDRFSPLFTHSKTSGVDNVRPAPAYACVYPFTPEDLAALAYYFAFDYGDQRRPHTYVAALCRQVEAWAANAGCSDLVSLDTGDCLLIWDTRPIAKQKTWRLRGLHRAVYGYCDQARTRGEIERFVSFSPAAANEFGELSNILEEFAHAGLILHEDNQYLSLAIGGEYQLRFVAQRLAAKLPPPLYARPALVTLASLLSASQPGTLAAGKRLNRGVMPGAGRTEYRKGREDQQ